MTDPGAAKRPIGLREGLRRFSTGLIAYGTIGVVVAVIGLLAFVWSLGRLNGAADQIDGTIRDLATTVHRTADTLTDAARPPIPSEARWIRRPRPSRRRRRRSRRWGRRLDALEASFRDFGILGQHPLAPAADVVATLTTNLAGLDERLQAVSDSLTADHDALAANSASLAALGDVARRPRRPAREREHPVDPVGHPGRADRGAADVRGVERDPGGGRPGHGPVAAARGPARRCDAGARQSGAGGAGGPWSDDTPTKATPRG